MVDQIADAGIGAAILAALGWVGKMAGWIRFGGGRIPDPPAPSDAPQATVEHAPGNNGKVSREVVQAMLSAHEGGCVRVLDQRFGELRRTMEDDKEQRTRIWDRMEEVIERVGMVDTKVSVQAARLDDHLRTHG